MYENSGNSTSQKRKRRDIRACAPCRRSKVKCDGNRPCARCAHNSAGCVYHEVIKDPTTERIEALEAEIRALKSELEGVRGSIDRNSCVSAQDVSSSFQCRIECVPNAVQKGLVTEQQASSWFQSFFRGSHLLVPVFCPAYDTYVSVIRRSAFLFDSIIAIGCRTEEGPSSSNYQMLQTLIREHLASVVLVSNPSFHGSLEAIQALTIIASYSENGWILASLALRLALQTNMLTAVDNLMTKIAERNRRENLVIGDEERRLFRMARIWYGAFNLEHIFSLDGERPPSIIFVDSPSRLRALVYHPESTVIDLRLLSQVELNVVRANAHVSLFRCWTFSTIVDIEAELGVVIRDTRIDLDLWLDEWTSIIRNHGADYSSLKESSLALLNLRIQHAWALITLHLKAVSNTGIENIAAMTEFQKQIVYSAKEEAVRHLQLLLEASSLPPTPQGSPEPSSTQQPGGRSAYLASFKWTMDFVWAKCAFSILLVLRLAMILRDPPERLMELLHDSHKVLEELKTVSVHHLGYFQILQVSVEKCEKALQEWMLQQSTAVIDGENLAPVGASAYERQQTAETEFEGYAPKEFLFEWHFPGLNLKHVPLGWQDLFIDFDSVF
ncbi:hypothetical protein AOQ84DRAFT_403939 [Glonium stellatum]|uniref:Zn(2)-C6 fungal-type domain-containing protein n=1 Tax=Glonium stellatum TaxID=574774 RepID=A0A8E2F2Z0_9PEZI|nr:hypothetical protein AOQ84DRAFT_403939 [Glonium stellatum]